MIAPHGGTLVQQWLPPAQRAAVAHAPSLSLSARAVSDVFNIASGAFSPLRGFMDAEAFRSVVTANRIASVVWTIPVVLDVSAEVAQRVRPGHTWRLCDAQDIPRGVIEVSEVFPHDKDSHCMGVFGTLDPTHPGVSLVQRMSEYLVGGRVWAFQPEEPSNGRRLTDPLATRAAFEAQRWRTVAGFQTRNVPHRAHEYQQRRALELTDGLFIQPVVGWVKRGDYDPTLVQQTYAWFIQQFYPGDRVILGALDTAMRYAGPKEAVFHAIIRKNFGCTHFIVGRDHAGVGCFYEPYQAQEIFNQLPDLEIGILKFREPFFCRQCEDIKTSENCEHGEEVRVPISGTQIRQLLAQQRCPPPELMRTEVFEFLVEQQRQRPLFWDGDASDEAI